MSKMDKTPALHAGYRAALQFRRHEVPPACAAGTAAGRDCTAVPPGSSGGTQPVMGMLSDVDGMTPDDRPRSTSASGKRPPSAPFFVFLI